MFKYQLKDSPIEEIQEGFMEDYLRRLGVSKISSFLDSPEQEDELDPFLLNDIEKGLSMLYKHLELENDIFLVVDSDVDGYSSAAIMYQFIKQIKPDINIEYYIHPEKEHGIVPETVPYGVALAIVPDAGSNQYDELQELDERGIEVLVLDHHLVDQISLYKSDNVVIINNQLSPKFTNKSSSGAGVVYKFIQAYCRRYKLGNLYENYTDLAALGILSDMMLITELDNNYIIKKGLKNIKNKMFQALLNKQSFSVSSTTQPNIIDVVFYVTPVINGTIRMGTLADKANLFEALVTPDSVFTFSRTWRDKEIIENLYDKVARESYNIKEKQNRITLKTMEGICEVIEREELYKNQIIVYKTSKSNPNEVPKSLTGLVAMKILQKYNRPTLILRPVVEDNKTYFRGSGRGKKMEGFPSFKDYLTSSGIVDYAQGHDMAFGAGIEESRIPSLVEHANSTLAHIDFGTDTVDVDYIFTNDNLDTGMLYEFAKHIDIYGNGIPQPAFAFELMLQPSNFNIIGKKKDTIKISYGGVTFIKFRSSEWAETVEYNNQFPLIKATIIGRSQLNEFNGNVSTQIVIDHMNLEELDVESLI